MYIGFVVHHVVRKVLISGAVLACAGLATKVGRRVAKVGLAAIRGAAEGIYYELKATPDIDLNGDRSTW
jgi:hypothetical protein